MNTRRKVFYFFLVLAFLWLISVFLFTSRANLRPLLRGYVPSINFITVHPRREFKNSSWKTILLWTDYFGTPDWEFKQRHLDECAKSQCKITTDRRRHVDSDAILFNTRSLDSSTVMPVSRSAHQVWVLHNSEPPYYIFMDWDQYAGVFNWTSWYRLDADVYSPYGNFTKISKGAYGKLQNYFAYKSKLSYWAASSCTDRNRRYRLVSKLEQHLDLHTYGSCGRLKCAKGSPRCKSVFRDYKFALSLENGLCRDYVTEKFWGALGRDQIPVVWGGADYNLIAPPKSFIDVRDYETIEDLAAYIKRVDKDEKLYNSYFAWRKDYVLTEDQVVNWCSLCKALHDKRKPSQTYTDLKGWAAEDSCHLYSTWRLFTDHLARFFFLIGF